MHFKDLKSKAGIKELNEWLQSRSYIDGFLPTKADTETFSQLGVVTSDEFAHVLRWFNHIKSFTDAERKHWSDAKASTSAPQKSADVKPKGGGGDDDDFDLFGEDDEDDEEKERVKQERLKAYEDKKSKKPGPIAKSSIVLDVKPWDDQTDLKEIERKVREIACDGLIWAQQAKIIPVAFGISKLQIGCVVEDDKVSVDFLEESITALEDLVQSVDIAAFNKI